MITHSGSYNPEEGPDNASNEAKTFSGIPEYDFEQGKDQIIETIIAELEKKNTAVIAFNSTSQNVGKTTLRRELGKSFQDRDIATIGTKTLDGLSRQKIERRRQNIGEKGGSGQNTKTVIIVSEWFWGAEDTEAVRSHCDGKVGKKLNEVGVEAGGVDLWVGIHTPENEFSRHDDNKPLADIIIRNTQAS